MGGTDDGVAGLPLSYWHDSLTPGDTPPRPPLPGDDVADIAIVGAGFSGLWTAYYLLRADPDRRVMVLERDTAGFGASGRNGGWCVGDQSASLDVLAKHHGPDAPRAIVGEMHRSVDEVGAVVAHEDIDCGFAKAGALIVARNEGQWARIEKRRQEHVRHGLDEAFTALSSDETQKIVNMAGAIGSVFTPNAAAVHPARLARGLADAVEALGGVLHEATAVTAIAAGEVRTEHGTVRSPIVIRATEAYTATLDGRRRDVLPLGNFMVATEPLDDATWAEIGLAERQLFEDGPLMLGYGQRTTDGRITWGGRAGLPYWRSVVPGSPMTNDRITGRLERSLVELFPALESVRFTHRWGGVLGVTRDLRPGVGLDPATGLGWAGGYFGAGVAPANAAGRTLVDLIDGVDSDLTRLPWTNHRSRRWELEPFRWLGVQAAGAAAHATDWRDTRRGRAT